MSRVFELKNDRQPSEHTGVNHAFSNPFLPNIKPPPHFDAFFLPNNPSSRIRFNLERCHQPLSHHPSSTAGLAGPKNIVSLIKSGHSPDFFLLLCGKLSCWEQKSFRKVLVNRDDD
ncbi:hypothetical protein NPIL_333951 [Nephila pilipes]|uniref:Uncharacterized protein n=1 Tax=Nephila pilipes TaxID=299642 RepID=A0A8X6NB06_NEPPI|nr:hypothetical protein NPIL_333951 [Nephila pilipes]